MPQKRIYKNPYHQTQSELAEWLVMFAHDFSASQVAAAVVERYPERTTGDPKADRRHAKEAICTVNPNDNRYNSEKWNKQFGLTQANYLRELESSHRQLATKALTALNAVYDVLEPAIPDLSPKEQVTLLPKAVLTLNQAAANVSIPVASTEQGGRDEGSDFTDPFDEEEELKRLTQMYALDDPAL
ncbi:MAG: hypothetical protein OXN17_01150 [Candidatus Poribacteria bacterium]|nr:hypothetical protein [Candidatus Poribacteria bacterium]MDE0504687.1 hypothetical protein [Candidatus Poribacteria bacterium]